MMLNRTLLRIVALAAWAACGVHGAANADVLDDVMKTGKLRVALTLDYPPFGAVDTSMKPEGYDVEMASLIADSLGVAVELVPVSSANKIPYIQTRKADVLLNIGANPERAKVVDFSEPYAPYYIGVFGPADIKISTIDDLAGKSIATTRGSFEETILSKQAPAGTDIRRYEDNATTISAFMSSQTQLIATGNIVAAAIIAKNPVRRPEQKLLLLNSPVRAAVFKGEARLLEAANKAIAKAKTDGTLSTMAKNWLKQPLPDSF